MHKLGLVLTFAACAATASAQQRPLDTQDPETIGAGRVLVEGGITGAQDITYPLSGFKGNLWELPVLGVNVGLSSIADLQITGGPYNYLSITSRQPGPLADVVTATGDSTHSVEDIDIGAKIRLLPEGSESPSVGFRFVTRLPNASRKSGIGQDTTDFGAELLVAKTIESIRVVGNLGWLCMSQPLDGTRQNDELTYGFSLARAVTNRTEIVGEIYGRAATAAGAVPIGTESRGELKFGGRFTQGPVRFDAAVFFGLNSVDPTVGFTAGATYVFNAFKLP
ncbi:MAG TPA: transporter [Vicinamibacterales bacterium]|nr:transporter [Vicinamibacterales bacterium]